MSSTIATYPHPIQNLEKRIERLESLLKADKKTVGDVALITKLKQISEELNTLQKESPDLALNDFFQKRTSYCV